MEARFSLGSARLTSPSRQLFERYAAAVAYIEVETPSGDASIGTAFHVGEGVFVTARHVVDGNKITAVANTVRWDVPDEHGNTIFVGQPGKFTSHHPCAGTVVSGPHFHPNSHVDVAAIVVEGINCPAIPLGSHLDDWINDDAFSLAEVVVLGYPPIPFAKKPTLIASRGEVNAVIDKYTGGHPFFIVSSVARGGFSGGPCLIEWDFTLGMVTESLVHANAPAETGFMAVVSIEPIFVCLSHHGLLPKVQADGWDGFWDD